MEQPLAGSFKLYIPAGFDSHPRKILYVGKATAKTFHEENAAALSFNGRSAFWNFARRLSKLADPTCNDLSNLAWSNIFKQGVIHGNPIGDVAEAQRHGAIQALRREALIADLSLVVLVTAGYYEKIVKEALDITDGSSGEKALTRRTVASMKPDIWLRGRVSGFPPILWTYHPQGKPSEYIEEALRVASELTGWK